MLIGCHVSAAGGLYNAPKNAAALGLETFQFFSRAPQGGPVSPLSPTDIKLFQDTCRQHKFTSWYVHAPYIINLASAERRIRENSISILSQEIRRANELGATGMMAHLGSASGVGPDKAPELVAEGLQRILEGYDGDCRFLIENSAGAGAVIGASFEAIADILDRTDDPRIGLCLDTAHAFASGYDLRTSAAVAETLRRFDGLIGLNRLVVIHANDSVPDFGERKDRHAHIGQGKIGLAGFRAIAAAAPLKKVDLILETPDDEQRLNDIATLKKLRDE